MKIKNSVAQVQAVIDDAVAAVLARVPAMNDEELVATVRQSVNLERHAFLVRGACVAHLLEQLTPLRGGRGKRDEVGTGVRARLTTLAAELGVHRRTLETDARIYDTFFKVEQVAETGGARVPLLAREFYVIALGAWEPAEAIKIALSHQRDPAYKRQQFRSFVQGIKSAKSTAVLPRRNSGTRLTILSEAAQALAELSHLTGKHPSELVQDAILAMHKLILVTEKDKQALRPMRRSTKPTPIEVDPQQAKLSFTA